MKKNEFFTFREYMKREEGPLTASLEDYLEMIYRLSKETSFTRINDIAEALNVQPSSTTKAIQKLAELNLINYEKYGIVLMTEEGKRIGEILIKRHQVIEDFLRLIGVNEEILLEETEKIEHTISAETVQTFTSFVAFFNNRPNIINQFYEYLKDHRFE